MRKYRRYYAICSWRYWETGNVSEDDDISLTFKERFQSALVGTQYMVDVNRTEEDSDKVENQPSD